MWGKWPTGAIWLPEQDDRLSRTHTFACVESARP
jgi:hypothetical protein